MKFTILNRKVHYWGSIIITIPLLLVIATGILLLLKKDVVWIQPETITGSSKEDIPQISFQELLNSAKSVKQAKIFNWEDIKRIDIQPGKGMAKVVSINNYEVQIDTQTGKVLQVAYRRSDVIEALHDGTYFHESVKYLVSMPSGIILFVLLTSGVVLFVQPYWVRAKRKKHIKPSAP